MNRAIAIMFLGLMLPLAGRAGEPPDLYRGQAIVTGTLEPERSRGFRLALMDVLVKVSGEPRLLDDKTLEPVLASAKDYVAAFDYEDRKKGMPIRDEQGTRDRPHDLRATFDKTKIDALLAQRNLKPWLGARPALLALIVVRFPANSFALSSDGDLGYAQRQALQAASLRRGLPATLPAKAALDQTGLTPDQIAALPAADLQKLAAAANALPLRGIMVWDEAMPGWRTQWLLIANGISRQWQIDSTSFDEAFRSGIGESAAILAGLR